MSVKMKKNLLFFTSTRADFGKLEPLAIAARDSGFDVSFFVTGMHMLEQYGMTKVEVQRVQGVRVHEFLNQRSADGQDIILAKTIMGFSDFCIENKPDLVIIHGDRVEALACGLVCATNYIRSVHIEGGEVSGTIDESFRHCNSKLANYHFVSSQDSKKRVLSLGESEDSIYVIGSPELDYHLQASGVTLANVKSHYQIVFEDFGVVIFHPVTSEVHTIGDQALSLFAELVASNKSYVVIAPNNDPGANDIRKVMNNLPSDRFHILPSMRFSHFSELMRNASALIGNSSAGVREAPFIGISSIDIGTRQTNRASAKSITHSSAYDRSTIKKFISEAWGKHYDREYTFGKGSAAELFVKILKEEKFWSTSLQKVFVEKNSSTAK